MGGRTPTDFDKRAGERLRLARERSSISQLELAAAAGVTDAQFFKYERGINRMPAEAVQICARMLGVPVAYFFDPEPGVAPRAFADGQPVRKVGGQYQGPGTVRGAAWMPAGYWLYVVSMRVEGGAGEFAHVFPKSVLRAAGTEISDA